jgi:hypothetical protein
VGISSKKVRTIFADVQVTITTTIPQGQSTMTSAYTTTSQSRELSTYFVGSDGKPVPTAKISTSTIITLPTPFIYNPVGCIQKQKHGAIRSTEAFGWVPQSLMMYLSFHGIFPEMSGVTSYLAGGPSISTMRTLNTVSYLTNEGTDLTSSTIIYATQDVISIAAPGPHPITDPQSKPVAQPVTSPQLGASIPELGEIINLIVGGSPVVTPVPALPGLDLGSVLNPGENPVQNSGKNPGANPENSAPPSGPDPATNSGNDPDSEPSRNLRTTPAQQPPRSLDLLLS